jgi:hypothetical protein
MFALTPTFAVVAAKAAPENASNILAAHAASLLNFRFIIFLYPFSILLLSTKSLVSPARG